MSTAEPTIDTLTTMEARHVTRILPGPVPVTLVNDVSLRVRQGEFVSITGPSGSGKSSLLYLLGLLDVPTKGQVYINGQPTQGLTKSEISNVRLHDIGFVFQYHFLLAEFSVFENIALPMERAGRYTTQEIRHRVKGLLSYLGIESEARKTPDRLSGGQRQRAAIARAIANNPTIILADEPTGNLDSKNSEAVCELFVRIAKDHGRSIISVTHDLDFASRADRRIHLVDGAIESDTPP